MTVAKVKGRSANTNYVQPMTNRHQQAVKNQPARAVLPFVDQALPFVDPAQPVG
jgi:hypothetical protein